MIRVNYIMMIFYGVISFTFLESVTLAEHSQKKIVQVHITADSANSGYEPWRAMDGSTVTMWHTQFSESATGTNSAVHNPIPIHCGYRFSCNWDHVRPTPSQVTADKADYPNAGNNVPHPHYLMVDMGESYTLNGFIYTPREKAGNGTICDYKAFISDEPDKFTEPVLEGTLITARGDDQPVKIMFRKSVSGRYFKLLAVSEINHQPFTSVAELELLCDTAKFVPNVSAGELKIKNTAGMRSVTSSMSPEMFELTQQYNLIQAEIRNLDYYQEIKDQIANSSASILESDRDAADVTLRRTLVLVADLKKDYPHLDLSAEIAILGNLEKKIHTTPLTEHEKRFSLYLELCKTRRAVMFANPLLDFSQILFVKKHRSTFNHLCDQFYGRTSVSGGGLYVMSHPFNPHKKPEVRNLLENSRVLNGRLKGQKLKDGSFLAPDLSFRGDKIAFAYVECTGNAEHKTHTDLFKGHWEKTRCWHIFTCDRDGSNLRMITDGTWNDFDPCFLPNERIAFISERRGGYLRCGRECPNYTLFDMNSDGSKMRCLSYHETNEWNPSVTNDGKILYTRWDYVDRFGCVAHHPWVTSLNGSDPRQVHGNFTSRHLRADSELDCRAIPDSRKFVATAGPHHGQSYGSIILVNPFITDGMDLKKEKNESDFDFYKRRMADAMASVKRVTPDVGFPESQNGAQVFGTPWPLSEKFFLCVADFSMQPGDGWQGKRTPRGDYGIYLIDIFGNRELIYRDPEIGCISPIPFRSRPMPNITPELTDLDLLPEQPYVALPPRNLHSRPTAEVSIANIYQSLRPWPVNTKIKALRIMQLYCMSVPSGPMPFHTGMQERSSLDSVNLVRGCIGTVPVEEDGSVHFTVPAQMEVYFQALDEKGMAVQSMRSGTYFQPGDNVSCVGCHESKHSTPLSAANLPIAFRRPPSKINECLIPGARPINYPLLVQPVWDKHCVECHHSAESVKKGAFSLDRKPYSSKWYASYNNLVRNNWAFFNYNDPLRTIPGEFGAHASRLYKLLQNGHYDVKLSPEEMQRVTLWLDSLSLFYGCYEKHIGEAQLRGEDAYPTLE